MNPRQAYANHARSLTVPGPAPWRWSMSARHPACPGSRIAHGRMKVRMDARLMPGHRERSMTCRTAAAVGGTVGSLAGTRLVVEPVDRDVQGQMRTEEAVGHPSTHREVGLRRGSGRLVSRGRMRLELATPLSRRMSIQRSPDEVSSSKRSITRCSSRILLAAAEARRSITLSGSR